MSSKKASDGSGEFNPLSFRVVKKHKGKPQYRIVELVVAAADLNPGASRVPSGKDAANALRLKADRPTQRRSRPTFHNATSPGTAPESAK